MSFNLRKTSILKVFFFIAAFLLSEDAMLNAMCAQSPDMIFTMKILLRDWGITNLSEIRLLQVGVAAGAQKPIMSLHALRTAVRPSGPTRPSIESTGVLDISNFELAGKNTLGGSLSVFEQSPSSARVDWIDEYQKGSFIRLDYGKREMGFCGFWIQLFESTWGDEPPQFLDASRYKFLTMFVRRNKGGGNVLLKVADNRWHKKQDAAAVGLLAEFVTDEVFDQGWQRVVVQLDRFPKSVSLQHLASLSFVVASGGEGQIDFKNIELCNSLSKEEIMPTESRAHLQRGPTRKATWVWNTDALLKNRTHQDELVSLLRREGFTDAFLQIPLRKKPIDEIPFETKDLKALISKIHRIDVRVHALDGYAQYAKPEYHASVKRVVEGIIRYNRNVPPRERFDGIHYDIEPYLLPGFGGMMRSKILADFLILVKDLALVARAGNIPFGLDIPSWYDVPDEFTGQIEVIEFDGKRASALSHILSIVDNIGVMSYRTKAKGLDGILMQVKGELENASLQNKEVFVGFETENLPDERIFTFRGTPASDIRKDTSTAHAVFLIQEGDSVEIALVPGSAILEFARSKIVGRSAAQSYLSWPVASSSFSPSGRLSFWGMKDRSLPSTMEEVMKIARQFDSFAGIAIHHSESYRKLLESSRER